MWLKWLQRNQKGFQVSLQSLFHFTKNFLFFSNLVFCHFTVACQTTLSLPLTFNLEKVLGEPMMPLTRTHRPTCSSSRTSHVSCVSSLRFVGDYYRCEEACEAVQESLSSSSLRRKLFLDGLGSSSDSSGPPSPERNQANLGRPTLSREEGATGGVEATSTLFSSPLSCSVRAQTPSTGQFSSSPIQKGSFRDASFGSVTSPLFLNGSCAAHFASPTVSPIVADVACTPTGTGKRPQVWF